MRLHVTNTSAGSVHGVVWCGVVWC
jgi:hypothetical protein